MTTRKRPASRGTLAQQEAAVPARPNAYQTSRDGFPVHTRQDPGEQPPAAQTRPAGPHDYRTSPGGPPVPAARQLSVCLAYLSEMLTSVPSIFTGPVLTGSGGRHSGPGASPNGSLMALTVTQMVTPFAASPDQVPLVMTRMIC